MKIVMFSHSSGLLGAERSLMDIVREATVQHDVVVVAPGEGPLKDRVQAAGAAFRSESLSAWLGPRHWFPPFGAIRLLQARAQVRRLRKLLEFERPDVCVTNTAVIPGGAYASKQLGIPHAWIVRESIGRNSQLKSLLGSRWIIRRIASTGDAICSISDFVDHCLIDGYGHALSTSRVSPHPRVPGSLERRPAADGVLRCTLPGHFSSEKGQHRAIAAIFLAKRRLGAGAIQLTLHGEGGLYGKLISLLVVALGLRHEVRVEGFKDDASALYEGFDVMLMPSANEAFGRTTFEAICAGVPVICFPTGGSPEIVGAQGGEVLRAFSVRAMADALVRIAELPAAGRTDLVSSTLARAQELSNRPSQYESLRPVLESLSLEKSQESLS